MIDRNGLKFEELFSARPHVFISSKHPLAERENLTLEDLKKYPYLSFEQGDFNSFYFSEEILNTIDRENIIARPLLVEEIMRVGILTQRKIKLSRFGRAYVEALKRHIVL